MNFLCGWFYRAGHNAVKKEKKDIIFREIRIQNFLRYLEKRKLQLFYHAMILGSARIELKCKVTGLAGRSRTRRFEVGPARR
jgi:hypothetical protein